MKGRYRQNAFWATVNEKFLSREATRSLRHFKSEGSNFKYAYWDPSKNGVRYFRDLLFNLASQLTDAQLRTITNIPRGAFGDPISVNIRGHVVDMDRLLSLFEAEFMQRHVNFKNAAILEIGAGYGRTPHFLLGTYPIRQYCIVDLPESLRVSRRYLRAVLPAKAFSKIEFVSVSEFDRLGDGWKFDLAINANSFAEMEPKVVRNYLHYIASHATYFYTRNPVGKYLDKSLDAHHRGSAAVRQALQSGPVRDIIDIYDEKAVRKQSAKFLKAYRPGSRWSLAGSSWAPPWSFYWQAVYKKNF